jgi:hypothetical protein
MAVVLIPDFGGQFGQSFSGNAITLFFNSARLISEGKLPQPNPDFKRLSKGRGRIGIKPCPALSAVALAKEEARSRVACPAVGLAKADHPACSRQEGQAECQHANASSFAKPPAGRAAPTSAWS